MGDYQYELEMASRKLRAIEKAERAVVESAVAWAAAGGDSGATTEYWSAQFKLRAAVADLLKAREGGM